MSLTTGVFSPQFPLTSAYSGILVVPLTQMLRAVNLPLSLEFIYLDQIGTNAVMSSWTELSWQLMGYDRAIASSLYT